MKLIQEFKEFAVKGNMVDIAIGVIIGASFNKVIDVLVKSVFMPPLSLLTDGVEWAEKQHVLRDAVMDDNGEVVVGEVAIGYGKFIETTVDFLIISFTIFVVVKLMNRLKNKAQDTTDKTVKTPKDIELLSRMTDLLEQQNALLKK